MSGGHSAVFAEFCGAFVIGEEEGDVGDVAVAAVTVFCADNHLELGSVAIEDDAFGEELDSGEGGKIGGIVWRTGLEPVKDGVVER